MSLEGPTSCPVLDLDGAGNSDATRYHDGFEKLKQFVRVLWLRHTDVYKALMQTLQLCSTVCLSKGQENLLELNCC